MGARTCARLLALAALALAPAAAHAATDPGTTTSGTIVSNGTEYPYLLYTPARHTPAQPAPLVVVAHGCQTTAQQEHDLTLYNRLADREGFVVLYPEVNELERQAPGPIANCWLFTNPANYFRGNADTAAIAAMTTHVTDALALDPERVYLTGVSAGGLMASALAATYPELYAAVALVASAGYMDGFCFANGVGIPVAASAQVAHAQMGERARVVPAIGIGSDADQAFPASCTAKAVEQSLRTNNLVLGGTQTAPLALEPAAVREVAPAGGKLGYTIGEFRDPEGCLVAERWIIHGMPHAWPGGDPGMGGYVDPRAPEGADATWAFFERYRRSGTGRPCTESSAADH